MTQYHSIEIGNTYVSIIEIYFILPRTKNILHFDINCHCGYNNIQIYDREQYNIYKSNYGIFSKTSPFYHEEFLSVICNQVITVLYLLFNKIVSNNKHWSFEMLQ